MGEENSPEKEFSVTHQILNYIYGDYIISIDIISIGEKNSRLNTLRNLQLRMSKKLQLHIWMDGGKCLTRAYLKTSHICMYIYITYIFMSPKITHAYVCVCTHTCVDCTGGRGIHSVQIITRARVCV